MKMIDQKNVVKTIAEQGNIVLFNQMHVTTTEHKIGKTIYFVCASSSEKATDSIDKKIKRLIKKSMVNGVSK